MNEIKERRKALGLTQVEAAKMIGVSRRTLQTYEENDIMNKTYEEILEAFKKFDVIDKNDLILNHKIIKKRCEGVFVKHPEVRCAYLYGSYARGEADEESDVDILVVEHGMGMDFFGMAGELEEVLGKRVDLQTHRQICDETFLGFFLTDAIKIYKKNN